MKNLILSLMKAARMEAALTGKPVPQELEKQFALWGAGIFRLVVMGEIKKGKSSFINAMLGEENLVPVSSNVATSTIFKIRYGNERAYRVYFLSETKKEPKNISEEELNRYGTEDGNPGNIEKVDFIEVVCPAPLLKSGIVIIDTPGLGGLFKEHKLITYQYVPRADAVFFVTDSVESPIGALELEYLQDIRKITPHLYFVQTKCAAVDTEARLARKRHNLDILSQSLNLPAEEIPYFLLDSGLRFEAKNYKDMEDLKESGYPQLMAFIKYSLQNNQHRILASRAMSRMQPTLMHLQEILQDRRNLLSADTEEKREEQKKKLLLVQKEIEEWQTTQLPDIRRRLHEGLQAIRLDAMAMCNKCRPAGELQAQFEEIIHQCTDVDGVKKKSAEISEKLPGYVGEVVFTTMKEVCNRVASLLEEVAQGAVNEKLVLSKHTEQLEIVASQQTNTASLKRMESEIQTKNFISVVRSSDMGWTTGASLGCIIGSLVPIVGPLVGIIAGGCLGACSAYKEQKNAELSAAKQRACGALAQAISSAYSNITSSLERILSDVNNQTERMIDTYIRTRLGELTRQREEISKRAGMVKEEIDKRTKEQQTLEQEFSRINMDVDTWFKTRTNRTAPPAT